MKLYRTMVMSTAVMALATWGAAAHADAAAAKKQFADVCSECHEVGDFEGESAADITAATKNIVAGGKMKNGKPHKKALKLTDAEIADLAAYMAAGK
jgi:mono/diheme cytochrome c family protein